jgi:hypothetical protein
MFMGGGGNNQELFGMINNILEQNGLGNNFFGDQFQSQMNFDNIFSQFGNMGQNSSNNFTNIRNEYNENNNANFNQNIEGGYSENEEEDETEEELHRKYIELRSSIINQLPRFKYSYYKNAHKDKETQE